MVTGTYSSPAEDEYFTVEEMHCCVSCFEEETDVQRLEWVEDFNEIDLSDCGPLSRLECLREGSVLAVQIEESYHVYRVDYLEAVELSDEQERIVKRDIVGTRVVAAMEPLDPYKDPLLIDIFQKEDLRNGMSMRSLDLTVLDFEQQVDSMEDFDPTDLDTDSIEDVKTNPQLLESRLRVINDNYIIDTFNLKPDIVADKL